MTNPIFNAEDFPSPNPLTAVTTVTKTNLNLLGSLVVDGSSRVSGTSEVGSNLTVSGNITTYGNVTATGTLTGSNIYGNSLVLRGAALIDGSKTTGDATLELKAGPGGIHIIDGRTLYANTINLGGSNLNNAQIESSNKPIRTTYTPAQYNDVITKAYLDDNWISYTPTITIVGGTVTPNLPTFVGNARYRVSSNVVEYIISGQFTLTAASTPPTGSTVRVSLPFAASASYHQPASTAMAQRDEIYSDSYQPCYLWPQQGSSNAHIGRGQDSTGSGFPIFLGGGSLTVPINFSGEYYKT